MSLIKQATKDSTFHFIEMHYRSKTDKDWLDFVFNRSAIWRKERCCVGHIFILTTKDSYKD